MEKEALLRPIILVVWHGCWGRSIIAVSQIRIKRSHYNTLAPSVSVPHRSQTEETPKNLLIKYVSTFYRRHGAVWGAQSELFFRLLLKNTVCPPSKTAYIYFWRSHSINGLAPYQTIWIICIHLFNIWSVRIFFITTYRN